MKKNRTTKNTKTNFYGFSKNCEDSMFVNPIVSANDCTGYTAKAPLTDEEAEAKSCIVNVPTTKYSIKEEKSLQPHHSSNVKNQSEHKKS